MIDIGVNLADRRFREDRDAVVERALAAGVRALVITGTSLEGSRAASALARERPGVLFSTAGVHPHRASSCDDETLDVLRELASAPEVVALGECGLDFNRDLSPRPVQETWFTAQMDLAATLGMPLFLHERDAHQRLVEILRAHRARLDRAVVHCFTGTEEELRAYLELDLHIGITGWICDERRGRHLQEIVRMIPADRLMVETDAPYLLPRDLEPKPRSRRNEPCHLPHVVKTVAACVGRPVEDVARETDRVARCFFDLA